MKIFDRSIAMLLVLSGGLSAAGVGSVTDYGSKEAYVDGVEGQVAQWRRRVAQLKTEQASVATGSVRFEALEKHIGALERDLKDVETTVEALRASGEHGWIRAQRRIDQEFSELEKTHVQMNARLR